MTLSRVEKGVLQFRPGTPGVQSMAAMYAPDRDLGWNYIPTVTQVLQSLAPERWPEWLRAYADANGVTADDIGRCAIAFATALDKFSDPDTPDPMSALDAAQFFAVPEAARNIFLMRLGQHMTGMYFTAVRQLTCPDVPQPLTQQLAVMMKKVEELVECLNHPKTNFDPDFGHGCRTIVTGLAHCRKSIWRSISKRLGLHTRTQSGK